MSWFDDALDWVGDHAARIGADIVTGGAYELTGAGAGVDAFNWLTKPPPQMDANGMEIPSRDDAFHMFDLAGMPKDQWAAAYERVRTKGWANDPLKPMKDIEQGSAMSGVRAQAMSGMGLDSLFDFGKDLSSLPGLPQLNLSPMGTGTPYSVPPIAKAGG